MPVRLLAALLLVALAGCSDRGGGAADGVVAIAYARADGRVDLQPVALVEGGRVANLTDSTEVLMDAFAQQHLAPGTTLALLVGGARVGEARVERAVRSEISGQYEAEARMAGAPALPFEWTGLAVARGGGGRALRTPPSAAEREALLDALMEQFTRARLAPEREWVGWAMHAALLGEGLAIASAVVDAPHTGTAPMLGEGKLGAFVLVQRGEGGAFAIAFGRATDRADYSAGSGLPRLVDVADLTGSGTPEVVVAEDQYEGAEYVIFGRANGVWQPLAARYVGL